MNIELFIARRMALGAKKAFSRFIIRIAIIAVSLSLSVMIITNSTVTGFQQVISEKIFNFWGHISITKYDTNRSYEAEPVDMNQPFYPYIDTLPEVKHIQVFSTKAGIIKTKRDIEGIVLKGVSTDFDWDNFEQYVEDGEKLHLKDTAARKEVMISRQTANRLQLSLEDEMVVYFIDQNSVNQLPQARKLKVSGVYKTGLEEYDKLYALVDLRIIQRLNGWNENQVDGFEVFLNDPRTLEVMGERFNNEIVGMDLVAETIQEVNPNIFDWLELQDINEYVILGIMVIVAAINMITALMILILERTNMIGILKALGISNWSIQKIFLYNAGYIITVGLFFGNLLGLGLCLLQKYTHFIQLPEESYYISHAPVNLEWMTIVGLNLGTLIICLGMLWGPSYLVTRIKPIKAIRFE